MGVFFALLVWVMAAIAARQIVRRAKQWRVGRAAKVDVVAGLAAIPRRYLHDVHAVVARDPFTARMHVLAAGGLLGGAALAATAILPPLAVSPLLWKLVAVCFAVAVVGAGMVAWRRSPKPARLSGGDFARLPAALAAFALGGLTFCLALVIGERTLALLGFLFAAIGGVTLATWVFAGPMRHALAGSLHLAFHPRPGRFTGLSVALEPVDPDGDRPGVETPADFAWNRLLSFDACVQCGRCEVACPAFAAGQPLDPKRFVQDLVAAATPPRDRVAHAGSPHPNARPVAGVGGPHLPIVGEAAMIHPDTLWSCTTCRACVEECPMMIEHVDAMIGLRRHRTLMLGAVPEKAAAVLDDLRLTDEAGGRPLAARGDFAAGLDVPVLAEGEETDVLLWLGEGAFDMRHGRTLTALIRLLKRAGVRFATLGPDERDCGDVARRLGDEATFRRLAKANLETLSKRRFREIVTADPHVLNSLRNDYAAFGAPLEVSHHTALLARLVAEGRLSPRPLADLTVTFHDPCYLGRWNGETEAPRTLLDALGLAGRPEMVRHGRRSQCCGGGGGAPLADVEGDARIPDLRMAQARATGAAIVAVACPTCAVMLEGVPSPRPAVMDVAELLALAVEDTP